jgi:hypothetical protein
MRSSASLTATPNVRYFFEKQTSTDTRVDYRCAPLPVVSVKTIS